MCRLKNIGSVSDVGSTVIPYGLAGISYSYEQETFKNQNIFKVFFEMLNLLLRAGTS